MTQNTGDRFGPLPRGLLLLLIPVIRVAAVWIDEWLPTLRQLAFRFDLS